MTKRTFRGTLLTGLCAYAATMSAMVINEAAAYKTEVPATVCRAETDAVGTNLRFAGLATWSGTALMTIRCPVNRTTDQDLSMNLLGVTIYGREGVDGSDSRTCSCHLNTMSCSCSLAKAWVNAGGQVATALNHDQWLPSGTAPEFRYILHNLSQNSVLAGMLIDDGLN